LTVILILILVLTFACHPEEAESRAKRATPDEGSVRSGAERTADGCAGQGVTIPTPKNVRQLKLQHDHLSLQEGVNVNGHPLNLRREAIFGQAFLAFAALFALLAIRSAPPNFPRTSLQHSSVNAISSHDERPRFDSSGAQWSAPVGHFLPFPPAADSAHLAPVPQLCSALQSKGFRYNRPPPAS
jgi:hypothetical protein